MKHITTTAAVLAALALLGAGCLSFSQPESDTSTNEQQGLENEMPAMEESMENEGMMEEDETGMSASDEMMGDEMMDGSSTEMMEHAELAPIDDSWGTYTNRAETFTFRYPATGRYAPEWEVSNISADDPNLSGDCYNGIGSPRGAQSALTVNGISFCHTKTDDPGAGQHYYSDYYLANVGGSRVLLSFTKHLTSGDAYDDASCHGHIVLPVGDTGCALFDEPTYEATLDQIVNTFRTM